MTEALTNASSDATPLDTQGSAVNPQSRDDNPTGKKPQRERPAQVRAPSPALERLFELYPKLFGARFLPLKLGVFQDLLARHPDDFKKEELKLAMGQHARSTRYLESVAAGHPRHDLDGVAVEPVAPEHVHHAILEVFRRKHARSREDLRPRLKLHLMDAIEGSGLSLEDYAERMRVHDDAANTVLDEALADLKLQAAKREALVRTFESSGSTVAEFCDMYGMNQAEVTRVLKRVRDEQAARAALIASRAESPESVTPVAPDTDGAVPDKPAE